MASSRADCGHVAGLFNYYQLIVITSWRPHMRQQLNEVITHTVCDGLVDRRVKYFKLVSLHKQTMPGRGDDTEREGGRGGQSRGGFKEEHA